MTKEELVSVVERAHALWNQHGFTPKELKAIHEAWWDLLGDLEFDDAMKALRARAESGGPPPRPGELRRATIDLTVAYMAPSGAEAWGEVRTAAALLASGSPLDKPLHPAVRETLKLLGGSSSFSLYTNGDRDLFIREYGEVVRRLASQSE